MEKNKKTKKKNLPRNLAWILATFLILLAGLAIILVWLGLNHKYFKVDNFVVNGNISQTDEEIIQEMGIEKNQSIFTLETKDLEKRIMDSGDYKSVEVKKVIPDSLTVDLVENRHVAYIQVDNGYLLVGADLKVDEFTDFLSDDDKATLFKISGAGYDSLAIGNEVTSLDREKEFLRDLTNHVLFKITDEVDFGSENGKALIKLRPDTLVKFGKLNEMDYKLSVVEKIVSDLQKKEINAREIILDGVPNAVVVTD